MKVKTLALVASTLIGAVGATNSFAAGQSCGAGSCGKKPQTKKAEMKKNQCLEKNSQCNIQKPKKEQSCGAGSCAKKKKK